MGRGSEAGAAIRERWPEAVAALALAIAACFPLGNVDMFGHMAAGREVLELGRVPSHDHFSLFRAEPQPWRNHNWLSGVLTFWLYDRFGAGALMTLKLALAATLGALVVLRARVSALRWAPAVASVLVLAAVPAARFRLAMRPHLFGLVLCAVLLLGLARIAQDERRSSRIGWLGALFIGQLLWTNLHGSSVLGLVLTGGYLVTHLRTPGTRAWLAYLLALQAVATALTPWGPALVLEAVAHVGSPAASDSFREWRPWGPNDPLGFAGTAALFVVLVLASVRPLVRAGPAGLASLGVTVLLALMAARAVRFLPWFVLLGTPAIAWGLASAAALAAPARTRAAVLGSLVLACIATPVVATQVPPGIRFGFGERLRGLPVAAGDWLASHMPEARLGGVLEDLWYLSFAAPHSKVLIDGRLALYGPDHYRTVAAALTRAHSWHTLLARYRIDAVVLQHTLAEHQTALAALSGSPAWKPVVIENDHVLFVRDRPATHQLLADHALLALPASYTLGAAADARSRPTFGRELARAEGWRGTDSYVAWLHGVDAVAGALRERGLGGLAPPASDSAREGHRRALAALTAAARDVGPVAPVHLLRGLVAAQLCRLDDADAALARAREHGQSRETLLLSMEIGLRRGEDARVRRFVEQTRALEAGKDDPWLAHLADALKKPPRCKP